AALGRRALKTVVKLVERSRDDSRRCDNEQRALLQRLLPQTATMYRQPRDGRQVFDGVRRRAQTGSPWRDVSKRHGP
ncbi:transposase, partial [Streptomyces sp. NPDC005093]